MKKVLIVHGWNYKLYSSQNKDDPWIDRQEFINVLKKNFEITVIKLPGFCGVEEPKSELVWSTKDYGVWLSNYIQEGRAQYDYLIGYSFGAPVLLHAVKCSNLLTPLILISPALLRADSQKSKVAHKFSFLPQFLRKVLADLYLNLVNPYFRYGTPFLRASYKKVVRENSILVLEEVSKTNSVACIYGSDDTATPHHLVQEELSKLNVKTYLIHGGGHNIAKTHYNEIIEIIKKITNEI